MFSCSLSLFLSLSSFLSLKTKKTALIIFPLSAFPYSNTNSSFFPLWINLKGPTAASLFLLCLFLLLLLIMTFTAWLSAVRTWLSLTQRCPDCSQLDSALSGQFSAWLSAVWTVLSLTQRCPDSVSRNFQPLFFPWFGFNFAKIFDHKVLNNSTQNFRLSKATFCTSNLFFHDTVEVFTPTRISPDCPFKSNQRPAKFLILTPRCAVWPRSFTPRYDVHRGVS